MDFNALASYQKQQGGRIIAGGKAKLMNGLGMMIPHKYQCVFENEKLIDVIVTEG